MWDWYPFDAFYSYINTKAAEDNNKNGCYHLYLYTQATYIEKRES